MIEVLTSRRTSSRADARKNEISDYTKCKQGTVDIYKASLTKIKIIASAIAASN